jgi:UDP-glucose 4-epimerase
MRVLITGGAGFIGSHLVEHFQSAAEVRVLDDLRTGHRSNLAGMQVEFIEGSILDRKAVRRAVQEVDYIFHMAALVSVPESVHSPHECVELNVTGLLNVLEEAASAGVKKLCFSSSAAVYGNNPAVPKVETMLPEPASSYAITKLDGEHYCAMFTAQKRLETACIRFFNVFGPRQDPASAYAAAVPIFIQKALAGEPLTIHGDGEQTRDFVYVKEIVAALAFAAETPGLTGVFNAGYGRSTTINEVARFILEATGSKSEIRYEPVRPGDVRHSLASIAKLKAAGFKSVSSLEEGMNATLAYYRSQQEK